jgi:hypothetical protein
MILKVDMVVFFSLSLVPFAAGICEFGNTRAVMESAVSRDGNSETVVALEIYTCNCYEYLQIF